MPSRYSISLATVVMLVLLRVNIGWHFFGEGMKHYADPQWTSEPTLRAATGPLASWYHAYLPGFHGLDDYLHDDSPDSAAQAVRGWTDAIINDWDADRQKFVNHYGLNEKQQARANQVFDAYQQKLRGWSGAHHDTLVTHVHEWRRNRLAAQSPAAADVPFQRDRVSQKQSLLASEARGYRTELETLEREYDNALAGLLDVEERREPPLARPHPSIRLVDGMMTWFILAVGALLLLGLFTRAACAAGALFLLSVVMMQPFWVSDALPTYNQYVEMVALLALATTPVGRWAGLDYFLHKAVAGNATKGQSNAIDS
ncbi:MAG: hypothetical protein WD845_06230 [Pirellulales bacterium]